MRKKSSFIYRFLIILLMFTIVSPVGGVSAAPSDHGSLTIHKYEQEPGAEQGVGDGSEGQATVGSPLPGVTYEVTQTHSYNPETDEWTEVTGGETHTMKTDEDGQVSKYLPFGRYSVKETNGPDHVNLNPDTFFVDIPMTSKDGSDLNYNVHIYPKNETIRGAVELTKIDGDSKEKLKGVKFELFHADGTQVEGEFVTNTDGKITVDGLAYGDYYFKETATIDGYVLGSQQVDFKIEKSNKTVKVKVKNYHEPEVEKSVDESAVNRGEEVTYTITVDLPADIKDYKNFVVTDVLHENLEFVSAENAPTGFTFNQDGQTLTWTATPGEPNPGEAVFTFTAKVKEDAEANEPIDNKATIDYTNKHGHGGEKETEPVVVTPTAGSLTIIKQDGKTEEKLGGAKFELRDGDRVVAKGTTDKNGNLSFTELDYGDYKLYETKAPSGYRLLTKPIDVTIDGEKSNVTLTVESFS